MFYSVFPIILSLMTTTQAHMELSWPPPFRSKFNSHAVPAKVDYSMTAPLKAGGADFPCKGYHVDMDDATGGGAPVVTWNPGSAYNFTVIGGAPHNGGSCQAALSYDKGKKFTVIHSYMGDCPLMTTGDFKFTVPPDAKAGPAIFAWSWLNQVGNREYYMNCASVNIAGSPSEESINTQVPFSGRPDLFVANLGNGCTTVEGKDTIYPHPGPDVTSKYAKTDDSGSLQGNCDSGAKIERSLEINILGESFMKTRMESPSMNSNASVDGNLSEESHCPFSEIKASVDGQCGGPQTCSGSMFGSCCSRFGFCGDSRLHCGYGCMSEFGDCRSNGIPSNESNGTGVIEPSGTSPSVPYGTSINTPNSAVPEIPYGTSINYPSNVSPEMPYSTGISQPSYASPEMPYTTGIIQPSYVSPEMPYSTGISHPSYASPEMPYGTGLSQSNKPDPKVPHGTGINMPSFGTGVGQPHKTGPKVPFGTGINMPPFGTGIGQPNKTGPKLPFGTGINMPNIPFMPWGASAGQPNKTGPKMPIDTGMNMPNSIISNTPDSTGTREPNNDPTDVPTSTVMSEPSNTNLNGSDSTDINELNSNDSTEFSGTVPRYRPRSMHLRYL